MTSLPKGARFQSTPPRRGRPPETVEATIARLVSIHAPAKGATGATELDDWTGRFQSTPPRRGRPDPSATLGGLTVFQSTPPRRGRLGHEHPARGTRMFQSTPPRRGRQLRHRVRPEHAAVSIHAPAKGATTSRHYRGVVPAGFNPRPREGGDCGRATVDSPPPEFQSTPPRRGRPDRRSAAQSSPMIGFNPRPREGGDGSTDDRAQVTDDRFNPRPREGGDAQLGP